MTTVGVIVNSHYFTQNVSFCSCSVYGSACQITCVNQDDTFNQIKAIESLLVLLNLHIHWFRHQ